MTDDKYLLIGESEPIADDDSITVFPRAGDVCRLRGIDDYWIPYGGIGNREEAGAFRFARFPSIDRVETFDVNLVCEIAIPCEDESARDAWDRLASTIGATESGTFDRRLFVFRAHGGRCATVAWNADGGQVYSGLHGDLVAARHGFEVFLANVEEPVDVTWCIGPDALREQIESGALSGVKVED